MAEIITPTQKAERLNQLTRELVELETSRDQLEHRIQQNRRGFVELLGVPSAADMPMPNVPPQTNGHTPKPLAAATAMPKGWTLPDLPAKPIPASMYYSQRCPVLCGDGVIRQVGYSLWAALRLIHKIGGDSRTSTGKEILDGMGKTNTLCLAGTINPMIKQKLVVRTGSSTNCVVTAIGWPLPIQ